MIFEALQSELVRFDFHLLRSKLQKIPEFNLKMRKKVSQRLIPILRAPFDAEKSYSPKNDFAEAKIAWVKLE